MKSAPSHPLLSCAEAAALEARLLDGEAAEWAAMGRAGSALACSVLRDFEEIGGFPAGGRLLVLAGKGHNAGDALLATRVILEKSPLAHAEIVFVFGSRSLRPLAQRAWRDLVHSAHARVAVKDLPREGKTPAAYDLCLDGIFGFQFRPPLPAAAAAALRWANGLPIRLRAAVDLPSGLNAKDAFRADFTYGTGVAKTPLLECVGAGRLRYLDLGFFAAGETGALERVLLPSVLAPLAALRSSATDKRSYGHLCLMGGSQGYPGAILMAVLAALRSGVGLVTACVPESLVPAFAARAPEAMWVGLPETSDGCLDRRDRKLLDARLERADALAIGPGLGREPATLEFVADLVKSSAVPVLLDADALQPDIIRAAKVPLLLTPHAGEFARIAGGLDLRGFCRKTGATVILKGPITRIAAPASGGRDGRPALPQPAYVSSARDGRAGRPSLPAGAKKGEITVYHSFFGGPVLARGGSGDLLAGLTGGLLAQTPAEPLLAACRGAVWHGLAADALARAHGQVSIQTTQLLDWLSPVLLESGQCPAN